MEFKMSEFEVSSMVRDTLRQEFARQLSQSYGVIYKQFEEALRKSAKDIEPEIQTAVTLGVRQAIASEHFQVAIRAEIIKLLANKFAGTFDGVMKAAAKRAADEQLIKNEVEKRVLDAIKTQ